MRTVLILLVLVLAFEFLYFGVCLPLKLTYGIVTDYPFALEFALQTYPRPVGELAISLAKIVGYEHLQSWHY